MKSKWLPAFSFTAILLSGSGCIGQLSGSGGIQPLIARPPRPSEIADCRHIRNLHDTFSISAAGLAVASGATGLSTVGVDSHDGKVALAIVSVVLGVLSGVATTGAAVETTNYANDYPSLGGCQVILGGVANAPPGTTAPADRDVLNQR